MKSIDEMSIEDLLYRVRYSILPCYGQEILSRFAEKDKRIAELEALVEKLKVCDNCKHFEPHCITNEKKCAIDNQYRNRTHKCDKWEAK